jgi:carotenoid 1,2-hydratase
MGPLIPDRPGSYRWYYFDVTDGAQTAVAIFMLGSLFSPRYRKRAAVGAKPSEHAAINFARYENGICRDWILSEYSNATIEGDRVLRIGQSTLELRSPDEFVISVNEKTPWLKRKIQVQMKVHAKCPRGTDVSLRESSGHLWHPVAPFAHGSVISNAELLFSGRGYHDGNSGNIPLGSDISSWQWSRTHETSATVVRYDVPGGNRFSLTATARATQEQRVHTEESDSVPQQKTKWGLLIPSRLNGAKPTLLESSPFYARLESHSQSGHSLHEVADFGKFADPRIQWMANLRTRYERGIHG